MKNRKQLIIYLFNFSQRIYIKCFKRNSAWGITTTELLHYPKSSFGWHLGSFLQKNGFELIPKVESHDALHVITGYGTTVEDEIALQFLSFGNGKKSLYLFGVMLLGFLLLPEYLSYYIASFKKGKQLNPFYHWDFKALLIHDFNTLILHTQTTLLHNYQT